MLKVLKTIACLLVLCMPPFVVFSPRLFGDQSDDARMAQRDRWQSLKVISHNVWYGFTKKPEPRHENWLKWMAEQNPDIVSLQELNGYSAQKLSQDAQAWGHSYSVLLKEDGFPTGITSRYPITDVKRIREGMHHGLLRCRIRGVWFYVIHFHPSNYARRIEEAQILKTDIASLPDTDPHIVLAGDFNGFSPIDREHYDRDLALTDFFRMLDERDTAKNLNNGQIDYGGLEAILEQGFVDTYAHLTKGQLAFQGTFPAKIVSDENHGTDRRLDYIFVSPNLIEQVSSATILRDDKTELLSDHIPIMAMFKVRDTSAFVNDPTLLSEHGAGEGPAWHPELGLLTSGEGNINRRDLKGNHTVYRQNAGSNGLMFDRQGRLVVCEPAKRRVTRIEQDGSTTVLAETFGGMKFNQPNDLAIDSKDRIYFSDPCYGDRSSMEMLDESGRLIEGVYRVDPDGLVTRIITHQVDRPNGLVVSHDDKYMFVADNNNSPGGARKLYRFELLPDGTIDDSTQVLLYDWGTTRGPDGMKLDVEGHLYVAAGLNHENLPAESADPSTAGVYVFSQVGKLLDFAPIPRDETTNCGFGGPDNKTLFVTAGGSLWSIQTRVAGQSVWEPVTP